MRTSSSGTAIRSSRRPRALRVWVRGVEVSVENTRHHDLARRYSPLRKARCPARLPSLSAVARCRARRVGRARSSRSPAACSTIASDDGRCAAAPRYRHCRCSPRGRSRSRPNAGTWLSVDVAPNGRDLVFDMLGDLYRLDIAGGRATRDHARPRVRLAAGLVARRRVARVPERPLRRRKRLGHARRRAARRARSRANDGPNEFVSPEWSPDGRALYASLYRADRNAVELWRFDVATGEPRRELSTRRQSERARRDAPAPDGSPRSTTRSACGSGVRGRRAPAALQSVAATRARGRTAPTTVVTHIGSAMRPVVSPDGALLAYAAREDGQTGTAPARPAHGRRPAAARVRSSTTRRRRCPRATCVPGYAFTPDGACARADARRRLRPRVARGRRDRADPVHGRGRRSNSDRCCASRSSRRPVRCVRA